MSFHQFVQNFIGAQVFEETILGIKGIGETHHDRVIDAMEQFVRSARIHPSSGGYRAIANIQGEEVYGEISLDEKSAKDSLREKIRPTLPW